MENVCGIYKITNLITNKIYIGQSVDYRRRWWEHKSRAFDPNNNCYDKPLYRSMRKYGVDNFKCELLEVCKPEELNEKEKDYIKKYNTLIPFGYNILGETDKKPSIVRFCKKCGAQLAKGTEGDLCRNCYSESSRKVERPTKDELYNLLINNSFRGVGNIYGVSDNTIRKWCDGYGIPRHSKFYKTIK